MRPVNDLERCDRNGYSPRSQADMGRRGRRCSAPVSLTKLQRVSLDVGLLESTAERFRTTGELQGAVLHVQVVHVRLAADPIRLRPVIRNLLRNAVQAAPEGSSIELCGEVTPNGYRIRVLDRGDGIPGELGARIFEPFMSCRPGGSGLGLAVCSGIFRASR